MLDLHTHSYFSDGTLAPEVIYQEAIAMGLHGIAITDHDTVSGALSFAKTLSLQQQKQCRLIVGVEISSQWKNESVHILAYGCDWSAMQVHLSEQLVKRKQRMQAFLTKLKEKAIADIDMDQLLEVSQKSPSQKLVNDKSVETPGEISGEISGDISGKISEEISGEEMIGRLHLAKHLISLGKAKDLSEAFSRYIGKGGCAYVPSQYPPPYTVIEWIHKAGGLAVLAHPQLLPKKLLRREILGYNWDGIEAIYGWPGRFCPDPYVDLAKKHRLFVTAGSDFHAKSQYAPYIGASTLQGTLMQQFLEKLETTKTGSIGSFVR